MTELKKCYKCANCEKMFAPPRYYWRDLSGIYCSKGCATEQPELPELIKDKI